MVSNKRTKVKSGTTKHGVKILMEKLNSNFYLVSMEGSRGKYDPLTPFSQSHAAIDYFKSNGYSLDQAKEVFSDYVVSK